MILVHLQIEWCVVTMPKKKQAAATFHVQWYLSSHKQKLCHDMEVPAPDVTKVQYYIKNMYSSNMFNDKEMQAWEIKPSTNKTWKAAKTHVISLYKSKEKFNAKRAEGELILACKHALDCMKIYGITPALQVFDNKIPSHTKKPSQTPAHSINLFLPMIIDETLPKKPSKPGKIIS